MYATNNDTGGITVIEVHEIPTDTKLHLEFTGLQGDVMKESMRVARTISWNILPENVKTSYQKKWKKLGLSGMHIHCPDASTPKDGPSAGGAITIAMISRLMNIPIEHEIAMTGEINLSGAISEIGGLEHKLVGAKKAGVKIALCPKDNEDDLKKTIKDNPSLIEKNVFEVIPVETIWDVLDIVFPETLFANQPNICKKQKVSKY